MHKIKNPVLGGDRIPVAERLNTCYINLKFPWRRLGMNTTVAYFDIFRRHDKYQSKIDEN